MSDQDFTPRDADEYRELSAEEIEEAERPRRSLWGLISIVTIVVVIIIVLMLLRDCGGTSEDASDPGGKTIEAVRGYTPVEGAVSVWVKADTHIDNVLSAAKIQAIGRIDLGEGRWVIEVPRGTEERAVKRLVDQAGVYDAGRVYER